MCPDYPFIWFEARGDTTAYIFNIKVNGADGTRTRINWFTASRLCLSATTTTATRVGGVEPPISRLERDGLPLAQTPSKTQIGPI